MPGIDFQAVRSLVSMAQVLERIGFVPAEHSGDQLDLWAAVAKTDLHTAAINLCEKLHLDVPWVHRS